MEIGLIDFQECNNMKNMLHDCKAGYISRPICAIITVKNMQSTSESLSVPFLKISKLITLSKTLDPDSLFLKVRVEILYEISSFFQQFTKKKKKIIKEFGGMKSFTHTSTVYLHSFHVQFVLFSKRIYMFLSFDISYTLHMLIISLFNICNNFSYEYNYGNL